MSYSYIGTRYMRPDSIGKVTGTIQYTADLIPNRKDLLVAKVKRIPCSHAKIISVNIEKAKTVPGVVTVLTADDIPGSAPYGYVHLEKKVIVKDETVCDGDPVALVAAETKDAAELAISLIEVEYESLPFMEDPRISKEPDSPLIHKDHPIVKGTNIPTTVRTARGDVDAALAQAAVIVENDYRTPIAEHCYMEPDVAIAELDRITGGITFYCPVHDPHRIRYGLCKTLNLPVSKIRVVSLMVGGGFGGKECSSTDCCAYAGILAMKTGRSVMYEMTRDEVFSYTSKRHRSYIKYKVGADKDGNILGMHAEGLYDKGAYRTIDVIPHRSGSLAGGPYRIPAADVFNYSVFTNHVSSGAMRGLGAPQQHFALECTINDLALKMGMDPIELRLKNFLKDGDYTIFGQCVRESNGMGMRECLLKVREQLNWDTPLDNSDPVIKRGRGVACYMYGSGNGSATDSAHVYMELNNDGSLNVNTGQPELGQGILSAMILIASETMGITPDKVNIHLSDTITAPKSGPASASRATVLQGNAIINACSILKANILKAASEMLNESVESLDIKDNVVFAPDYPDKCLPLSDLASKAELMNLPLATTGHWYPQRSSQTDPSGKNQAARWSVFAYGAHGVEVEVDTKTGIIKIIRSVHAIDLGKAINPDTAEGQIDGGSVMAFGWGLMEEAFLKNGQITNNSFHEYLIPTAMDVPLLESILVEPGSKMGPYGAKGIGEPVILGGAPALRNALLNATGLAMYEIPLTPVRVMAGLEIMRKARKEELFPFFKAPLEFV